MYSSFTLVLVKDEIFQCTASSSILNTLLHTRKNPTLQFFLSKHFNNIRLTHLPSK